MLSLDACSNSLNCGMSRRCSISAIAIPINSSRAENFSLIPDERLKSADLTGEWESKLKKMEKGNYDPEAFMKEIFDFTSQLKTIASKPNYDVEKLGPCPLCGKEVIEGKKGYGKENYKNAPLEEFTIRRCSHFS